MDKQNHLHKGDLAQLLSTELSISLGESRKAINLLFNTIAERIEKREPVGIIGFGSFQIRHRRARKVLHPKSREEVFIPERVKVVFRASKELKAKLNTSPEPQADLQSAPTEAMTEPSDA